MPMHVASGSTGRQIATVTIVGCVYFAAAKLSLKLAFFHPSATPVWPPTGIALASLLLIGYGAWPGIFLGAFLANLTTEGTVWTSLGIATGNTLEGVIGTYLVRAYANGSHAFDRPRDIFKFAALGAMVSPIISATIGVTSLALGGFAPWAVYRSIWFTWWLGDAAGALIFTPLLVLWGTGRGLRWDGRMMLERAVFLGVLLTTSWIVFGGTFAFAFLTVPFLVWAAFQFDQRETIIVIGIISVIAIVGTVRGLGPFVGATPNESLLLLQAFMGIMVLVALPLSSVVADNARRMASERVARREAERAVGRVARSAAVTAALSGAVTQEQVVNVIVDQAILALGGRAGFVSMLTEDGEALQLVGSVGYPEEFVETMRRIPLSAARPMTEAVKTGKPLFFESDTAVRSRYPDLPTFHQEVARAAIPLSTSRRQMGVLSLTFSTARAFDEDDRSFMVTLAHQCAQALERTLLYEHEHYLAQMLQRAFLPATLPNVPGIQIDAVYVPGAAKWGVGGDWYDVFRLPDGRIALSVGDVVGSGVHAGVMMGQLRQSIRAAALEGDSPSVVLDRANRVLRLTYEREGMATAIFGLLDPVSLCFTYASAGHPPPALATPDGAIRTLTSGGPPLGLDDTRIPPIRDLSLPARGLLVLYTDGLVESTRNVTEGEVALFSAMRAELSECSASPAKTLLEHVLHGRNASDDVAVVALSIRRDAMEEFALTLPAKPGSLRQVRQAVRELAQALHLDREAAFTLQVVVGEAVNNTVEHAHGAGHGTFQLRVWRDTDAVKVEVADQGQWRPERAEDQGHGLKIMRALAQTVEIDRQPSGTTVRLALPLAAPSTLQMAATSASSHGAPVPAAHPGEREAHSRDANAQRTFDTGPGPRDACEASLSIDPHLQTGPFVIRKIAGIPVVDVRGDVDLGNAGILEAALESAARLDKRAVVVSLTDASFFDSTAIHMLLRFRQRLATNRQRLLLAVARGQPSRRIIDLTGVSEAVSVFDSVEDAVGKIGVT